MNRFILKRGDDHVQPIEVDTIREARITVEDLMTDEIPDDNHGFRWLHVQPWVWRYQVVDPEGTAVKAADLEVEL